ncbi:hypothetical protein BJX62DRAFT_69115 [Aspergillus germanicus]
MFDSGGALWICMWGPWVLSRLRLSLVVRIHGILLFGTDVKTLRWEIIQADHENEEIEIIYEFWWEKFTRGRLL